VSGSDLVNARTCWSGSVGGDATALVSVFMQLWQSSMAETAYALYPPPGLAGARIPPAGSPRRRDNRFSRSTKRFNMTGLLAAGDDGPSITQSLAVCKMKERPRLLNLRHDRQATRASLNHAGA